MNRFSLVLAVMGGILLASTNAFAGALTWTLNPLDLGPVTAAGSFDFDAATGQYSAYAITFAGRTTQLGSIHNASGFSFFYNDLLYSMAFSAPLTDAGGTDAVAVDIIRRGSIVGSSTVSTPATSAEAPEPGSILLGGSGALAFALVRMRRRLAK